MESRIAFVDFDGVVNTPMWNEKGTSSSYNFPSDGKVNNYQAVQWLSEFCKKCKYDIVVTSTWRSHGNYKECLINGGLREGIQVLDKTDDLSREHPYPEKTRGWEVKKYLEDHPEIKYYVIIDDEDQFLPEQQHHFVKITNDREGFGYLEMQKCTDIYLKDLGHQSSHWLPKSPVDDNLTITIDNMMVGNITEPITEVTFRTTVNSATVDSDFITDHNEITINGVTYRKVQT